MAVNKRKNKFPKMIATRIPMEVWDALEKLVKKRQEDFPRYGEGDAIRSALVNHLKVKGFLEKGKNYL